MYSITSRLKIFMLLVASTVSGQMSAADAPDTILVFGDSISAAYGMPEEQGWVSLLTTRLTQLEKNVLVVNASISGETTAGGIVRLPKILKVHQPDIVILELGGNDGLRGYPISRIKDNVQQMTDLIADSGAKVLLIGMVLPPNYGKRYTTAFTALFDMVAQENNVPFLPFLLEGTATSQSLIQRDGIHPKPEAQPLLLNDIWPLLEPLLE
jgi:acyl-CoA thioesterase-1